VAAFDVTEGSTMSRNFAVTMKPGDSSKDITVNVQNLSETAVSYTIAFELDGDLPLTVSHTDAEVSDTTKSNEATELLQEDGELIWHTKTAKMAGSLENYNFQLTWDKENNGYQYAEGIESVTVEITAVQED
jgi:hypothetical protein